MASDQGESKRTASQVSDEMVLRAVQAYDNADACGGCHFDWMRAALQSALTSALAKIEELTNENEELRLKDNGQAIANYFDLGREFEVPDGVSPFEFILNFRRTTNARIKELEEAQDGFFKFRFPLDDRFPVDREIDQLCRAINSLSGLSTFESCCGHGDRPIWIWLRARDTLSLKPLIAELKEGEWHQRGWSLSVDYSNGGAHVNFFLEGPLGGYDQADVLAQALRPEPPKE